MSILLLDSTSDPPFLPLFTLAKMSVEPPDAEFVNAREVTFERIRRHAHDVRNHFGGINLETTLIRELVSDEEVGASAERIRRHLEQLEGCVRALLLMMVEEPRPVTVAAGDLFQLWRLKLGNYEARQQAIEWPPARESLTITVDVRIVVHVLCKITWAAWQQSPGAPLQATWESSGGTLVIGLVEASRAAPLAQGLLDEAHELLSATGAQFNHAQDVATGKWITELTFPGSPA